MDRLRELSRLRGQLLSIALSGIFSRHPAPTTSEGMLAKRGVGDSGHEQTQPEKATFEDLRAAEALWHRVITYRTERQRPGLPASAHHVSEGSSTTARTSRTRFGGAIPVAS